MAVSLRRPAVSHLAVLIGYIAVGVAVTWPHATFLAGRLPATRDTGSYVWGFWWMAHSVLTLSDPWHTTAIAAPIGAPLGMHALMPLVGLIMTPVTVIFGPSASYTVLMVIFPGLLAYVMYRLARLWVPSQLGAIAAGAFFGYSALLCFQTWLHLNLVAGVLFLPMTLEAAVRLRRRPGPGQALVLGLVLAGCLLTDQESAILALILAALALAPWLMPTWRRPEDGGPREFRIDWARFAIVAIAGVVFLVVAAPQIVAIVHADAAGSPSTYLDRTAYVQGIKLPDMFLPSPRLNYFGLGRKWHSATPRTFGFLPPLLAVIGLALAWRRRNARLLALLFLATAVLSLGADLILPGGRVTPLAEHWDGDLVSLVLPYTWFIRIPFLAGFREPSRIAELGLVPMALLAGYTVNWLRYHARPLLVVVLVLAVFEFGLATPRKAIQTMPTGLGRLDAPIAADHSGSIVVDIPFGLRGGTGITGLPFPPESQVLATYDHHPLADGLISRIPTSTAQAISSEPFYQDLLSTQTGHHDFTPRQLFEASVNAADMHIGWVLLWVYNKPLRNFLMRTGFHYVYRAEGASVWRPDTLSKTVHGAATPARPRQQ